MAEIRELSARECEALLRSGVAGRVAVSTPTGPHIVPVNYSVVDDAIIVRTSPYSLLGTYGRDTMLAFEIDGFDRVPRARLERAGPRPGRGGDRPRPSSTGSARSPSPSPWAGGARSLYLRLRWTELSGRQLGADWDPLHDLPVECRRLSSRRRVPHTGGVSPRPPNARRRRRGAARGGHARSPPTSTCAAC